MSIQQILKNTNSHLDLFSDSEIAALEGCITTRQSNGNTLFYARCLKRDKDIRLKPEEVVRQLYLHRLIEAYGYPQNRIAVEFPVSFGTETKFADIVILDKDHPNTDREFKFAACLSNRAVEIAIEQNEEAAFKWLEQ